MAEKKITRSTSKASAPIEKKSTIGLRIGAFVCWAIALVCEVMAILNVTGKFNITEKLSPIVLMVIFLVVDLIFVIVGSRLWVNANHINPASEKNKFTFFLYNNLGVLIAIICFIPFIIITLTDKNADKKTKTIGAIVAAVCLAIAGLGSADWDPVSQEQQAAERQALYGTDVYWTKGGKKYHTSKDCQHLDRSKEVIFGSVAQAVDEGKDNLCKTCAKRNNLTLKDLEAKPLETTETADSEAANQ